MDKLAQVKEFLKYKIKAKTAHGVHSPFLFRFVNDVLQNEYSYYSFPKIEQYRRKLLLNKQKIEVTDLGAGSKVHSSDIRKVSDIARSSLSPSKYARLLFRIANFVDAKNKLELGTSLGISTAYLASQNKEAKCVTIEGCPNIAKIASQNFKNLGLKNIEIINADFTPALEKLIDQERTFDFVYIDGNHRGRSLIEYFEIIKKLIHPKSVVIIDDINWSVDMNKAWRNLCLEEEVTISIDLFKLGVLFCNPEFSKEHFQLKY